MATTTASVTISSGDLTADALSHSRTATLNKAGQVTGLDQTTGVARKIYKSASIQTLFDSADYGQGDKAHKIYLANPSTVSSEYFTLSVGDLSATPQVIGRLYAGDWCLLPWTPATSNTPVAEIGITPSVATAMTLEYLLIFEE